MNRYITVGSRRYLIRGSWSCKQLREQYASFQAKYDTELTFSQWLAQRGKVYVSQEVK